MTKCRTLLVLTGRTEKEKEAGNSAVNGLRRDGNNEVIYGGPVFHNNVAYDFEKIDVILYFYHSPISIIDLIGSSFSSVARRLCIRVERVDMKDKDALSRTRKEMAGMDVNRAAAMVVSFDEQECDG